MARFFAVLEGLMGLLGRLGNTVLRRGRAMDGIDAEMEFHVQCRVDELVAAGVRKAEARRVAQVQFGNRGKQRDAVREVESFRWIADGWRDLLLAARNLRRRPVFVATAVVSIALSLAAVTSLFSYVDALFLRPLPLPAAHEIVAMDEFVRGEPSGGTALRMKDWAEQIPQLAAVGGYYTDGAVMTGEGEPARVRVMRSYGRLLDVLGQKPVLGRGFTRDEEAGLGDPVVVLSYGMWQRRFGGDAGVLNRPLKLDDGTAMVVGVLPQGSLSLGEVDMVGPAPPGLQRVPRTAGFLGVIARMRPGVSRAEVQSQMDVVSARLAKMYPATDEGRTVQVVGLQDRVSREYRKPLFLLFAAALMVLVMACVNVGSLLLARGAERTREAAIRISLGAGRASLMRLYLMESFLLALLGGVCGVVAGAAVFRGLQALMPPSMELPVAPVFDWRVVVVGGALAVLSGVVFGLAPAWMAYATKSIRTLSSTQVTAGRGNLRWRKVLVVAQVAMGTVLLTGVGLAARSLYYTRVAPMGFEAAQTYTVQVNYGWDTPASKLNGMARRAMENLQSTPGVVSAGMVDVLPVRGTSQRLRMQLEGVTLSPELAVQPVNERTFAGEYFRTMGIPLLQGRMPRMHAKNASPEILVNRTFAQRYFPGGDVLEHRMTLGVLATRSVGEDKAFYRIVGVVGDTRVEAMQTAQQAEFFVLYGDTYWPYQNYVVKGSGGNAGWVKAVHDAVQRADPGQVVSAVTPVGDAVASAWVSQKVRLVLLAGFTGVALLLACVGVYGVLTSDVLQRAHEIGVRLALGAERALVVRNVLWSGLRLVAMGFVAGSAIAFALGRLVATMLYGVKVVDPVTWGGASAVLLGLTMVCSYLPARRAAGIDPARALRAE